jgi:hypothetical protein
MVVSGDYELTPDTQEILYSDEDTVVEEIPATTYRK